MFTSVKNGDSAKVTTEASLGFVEHGQSLYPGGIAAKRASYGGKGALLYELQAAGFRVPEFVVSPSDLEAAMETLGVPLIIRSSATLEDSAEISFAGQFESFPNLRSLDEVRNAVDACVASARAKGVAAYCRDLGVEPAKLRMHVIVQRMIQPELAGVVFNVNPMTGAPEQVIEACAGFAEDLLAGRQSALPHDDPLLARYRPEIERTARQIQKHFGTPQDIEFAVEEGLLYVLQTRPITRIHFDPQLGEWTNADFRDGGVSSGCCSPLMWSLYEMIWNAALKSSLRELHLMKEDFQAGRMFYGRPYWNLGAVKQCLAALPGFVEREFDSDLNVQVQYDGPGRCTPMTFGRVMRAIPTMAAFPRYIRQQRTRAETWLAGQFDALVRPYERLPNSDGQLDAQFRQLIEFDYFAFETAYFRTIYAASLAKLSFKSSFPDADFNSLAAALPSLSHMGPCNALRGAMLDVRRGRKSDAFEQIIKQYRHQSLRGLDIRYPRWDEDELAVRRLAETQPPTFGGDPRLTYERARQKAMETVPRWRRRRVERKLDCLRRLVWLREEMRDLSSRLYYHIRRHVLEIAARRGFGDDIFFMTYQQILADDASQIDVNRDEFESYRNFAAPNEIGGHYDEDRAAGEIALQGIAASPGVARGTARVVHSIEEAVEIEPGAILVCPFTDPGWTPLLARVAAVVTENGGLLSHAAVICREFGIPAVLGVPRVTRRIADGAQVSVDGNLGAVEILAVRDG